MRVATATATTVEMMALTTALKMRGPWPVAKAEEALRAQEVKAARVLVAPVGKAENAVAAAVARAAPSSSQKTVRPTAR